MDFKQEGGESSFHVFSTTTRCGEDASPMQFITVDQLAHYKALEVAALAFLTALGAVGPAPAAGHSPPNEI